MRENKFSIVLMKEAQDFLESLPYEAKEKLLTTFVELWLEK